LLRTRWYLYSQGYNTEQPETRTRSRMKSDHRLLPAVTAVVNLVLGMALLLFPAGVQRLLGLPPANTCFYVTLLGGMIFGIGIVVALS